MYSLGNNWRIWTRVEQGWNRSGWSGIRLAGCRVTGRRATQWRELRDDGGPRGGCPGDARDICQRDERWVDRTSGVPRWIVRVSRRDHGRQSWPFSLGSGNIKPHTSSASDQRTDLSRRRIPLFLSLSLYLSLSLSLSVSCTFSGSLGGGQLPRSQSKGNPERSTITWAHVLQDWSPLLMETYCPRLVRADAFFIVCLMWRWWIPGATRSLLARPSRGESLRWWCTFLCFEIWKSQKFESLGTRASRNWFESSGNLAVEFLATSALARWSESRVIYSSLPSIGRFPAAVISWINNVTSRTLINRLGRRVCVCKLGRVRRRDAGQYYYEDKRTDAIYHQGLPASAPWHPALREYSSGWERRSIVNFCEPRSRGAGGMYQTDDFIFHTS